MSMLARYKKSPGQILELVKLIEESAEPKRSQLLEMVRSEDAEFAARVEAKLLAFSDLRNLNPDILAEIISATPAKHVALALFGETNADFVKIVERCLGAKFSAYKEEISTFETDPPNVTKVEAGQRKLMAEARKLEKAGAIKLPSKDGDSGDFASSSSSGGAETAASNSTQVESAGENTSTAISSAAVMGGGSRPSIESFGFEAPPPGMSGERFETFIKKMIG